MAWRCGAERSPAVGRGKGSGGIWGLAISWDLFGAPTGFSGVVSGLF